MPGTLPSALYECHLPNLTAHLLWVHLLSHFTDENTEARGSETVASEELQPARHIGFYGASPGSLSQCAPFFPLPVFS